MRKLDTRGYLNPLLIPFILTVVFLFGIAGFAIWAFTSQQDYKNNSDEKSATAVKKAETLLSAKKEAEFLEREKKPLKDYRGPDAFGGVSFSFPKTWSAYVDERGTSSTPVNNYFHPDKLPVVESDPFYALRVQVMNTTYDNSLKQYDGQIKQGKLKATPFRLALVPSVLGIRLDGEITAKETGSIILLPLRDKTVLIWTESQDYIKDFDSIILPSFKFVP